MAISQFPPSAAGGRPDTVFGPGLFDVNITEGYYILEVLGDVSGDGFSLFNGFRKLPAITSLNVGVTELGTEWDTATTGLSSTAFASAFGLSGGFPVFIVGDGSGNLSRSFNNGASWTTVSSGFTSLIFGIDYAPDDDIWVFVGQGGELRTSDDGGSSWTSRNSDTSAQLRGVAYGDGLWVACDANGNFTISSDGINWSFQTGANTGNTDITFGNGLFVAVDIDSTIQTSVDGITWTSRTNPTGKRLERITFGDGLFVASGDATVTSSDGITWTERTIGTTSRRKAAAFTNGTFLLGFSNGAVISQDGITWTSTSTGSGGWNTGAGGNGAFILVEDNNAVYSEESVNPNAALLITELPTAIEPEE